MEELRKIWNVQKSFNRNFVNFDNLTDEERQRQTKEYILHLFSETDEILREINWKMHRKKDIAVNKQNLTEELIDVFKYWCSILQLWDITPEEFVKEFHRKSSVVEQRYKQEIKLNLISDENVIGIDIDGVLADYPRSFINFISNELSIDFKDFSPKTHDLCNELGMFIKDKQKIVELKHKYRSSGYKRNIPVIKDAVFALKELKELGYTIVLLTARPYKEYPRMFADTMEWLDNNGFVYDAIIWDENKENKIIKQFPKMKFMIEDNLYNALKISEYGYKVILFNKTYNKNDDHVDNVFRVNNWIEAMEMIRDE